MKTTVDIPEDVYRKIKVKAASEGRKVRELIADGLILVLDGATPASRNKRAPSTAFDVMSDACGCATSGIQDLATNPKHMEGFGRA
jgi:hypothetical protein